MRKICTKCDQSLEINLFAKKGKDKTSSWCKECQKEYSKEHYNKNKKYYRDKAKKHDKKRNEWYNKIRKNRICDVCGEGRWWVLDYHHKIKSTKDFNISEVFSMGYGKQRMLDEIKKCDVLCSNCHRDLHYKEKLK